MTSPATLEPSTPLEVTNYLLRFSEALLKRKAAILEEFIRNNGHETSTAEDRCRILRRKIDILEDEISIAGKSTAAKQYLEHAPASHFVPITRDQFSEWLQNEACTNHLIPNTASGTLTPPTAFSASNKRVRTDTASPKPAHYPAKRPRTDVNDKPPCLRCKIIKKRCDSLENCNHCPTQSYDNPADFWKVLGCFRSSLFSMSQIFCPAYTRSTSRALPSTTLHFILIPSQVSPQKKRRMLNLLTTSAQFSDLQSSSWANISERSALSQKAILLDMYKGTDETIESMSIEGHEAAWGILHAVSMDATYAKATAYNLFDLLRLGNEYSKLHPTSYSPFVLAKCLLRQSVELYLLERLCGQIAAGSIVSPPFVPSPTSPNTLLMVDLLADFETLLETISKTCTGRAKLTGHAQLAIFYTLLIMSVTRSLLVDAYSLRAEYESPSSFHKHDAARINSAFKALVSIFCWSSKNDIMLQDELDSIVDEQFRQAILETRSLAKHNVWAERGYKGSKDFLLSLGSCWYADGVYNGFFVQKFGLDILPCFIPKAAGTANPSSQPGLPNTETLTWVIQT